MKRKRLFKKSFIDEQIDLTEAKIRHCKYGTPEYGRYLDIRNKLIDQKKKERRNVPWKDIADVTLKAVEVGGNLLLVYEGYKMYGKIAKLSYGFDEDMRLCNGRVNNMKENLMKIVPKKI